MIKQKTVTIGTDSFMLTTLPAIGGIRILKQLIKLGGPAFAAFQGGVGADGNPTTGGLAQAIEAVLANLDSVGVEQLVQDLVSSATKDNMSINFNMEFSGEYDKLFLLVKEIVEFNYGSVFTLFGSDAI